MQQKDEHPILFRAPEVVLTLMVVCAMLFTPGLAQDTVAVSPSGALLDGQLGETLNATVRVDNPAAHAVAVNVSVQDFGYDDKGELTYFPAGSLAESVTSWVTLNPASLTVPAHGSAEVRYSVTVPSGAAEGTHWGVIFFESGAANPPTPGKTLATFKVRVGYALYVNVGRGSSDGRIVGIVGAETRPGLQYQFAIQYLNSGNLVSLLNGNVEVRDSSGDTVVSIPITRVVALPGSIRLIKAAMVGPLPPGDYNALVVLDASNQSTEVAGQYGFHLATGLSAPPAPATSGQSPRPGQNSGKP